MAAGPGTAPREPAAGTSPRPGRLRTRPEFLAVAKGRRFHTERLTVQALPRSRDPDAGLRIGFTVTRREGHATERNRIRRRLRAASRTASGPYAGQPVDLVVIGRKAAIAATYRQLVDDLGAAFFRLVDAPKPGRGPTSRNAHA